MLTNILLGLILIALILIIYRLEKKHATTTHIKDDEKAQEILENTELFKLDKRLHNIQQHCNQVPCSEQACKDEAEHDSVVKEEVLANYVRNKNDAILHYVNHKAKMPKDFDKNDEFTSNTLSQEQCINIDYSKKDKSKRKVNKEYERKIADGFFEDLVIKILKEKREKMCSTVDILKRHRTTMNTFKRHATKEQIAELMALQVETKKQSVDKQRQNIYHKRS